MQGRGRARRLSILPGTTSAKKKQHSLSLLAHAPKAAASAADTELGGAYNAEVPEPPVGEPADHGRVGAVRALHGGRVAVVLALLQPATLGRLEEPGRAGRGRQEHLRASQIFKGFPGYLPRASRPTLSCVSVRSKAGWLRTSHTRVCRPSRREQVGETGAAHAKGTRRHWNKLGVLGG